MLTCSTCNAPLQGPVDHCPFCGAVTAQGLAQAQRAEAQAQAAQVTAAQQAQSEAQAARARAAVTMQGSSKWSLIWGLVGLCTCLLPIASVVAVVLGVRARSAAKTNGFVLPGGAIGGLVLGLVGLGLGGAVWVAAVLNEGNLSQRKAQLRQHLPTVGGELDVASACALAELEVMNTKHAGFYDEEFECETTADLRVDDGRAVLSDWRFLRHGSKVEIVACLQQKKARWVVAQLREDDHCP